MPDNSDLHLLLSEAYTLSQHGKKAEAHTTISKKLAENPQMLQSARTRCDEMAQTIRARALGGRVGCVITKAYHEMLSAALKEHDHGSES